MRLLTVGRRKPEIESQLRSCERAVRFRPS